MRKRLSTLAASYRGRLVFGYAVAVVLFATAWAWSLFGPVTDALVSQQEEHLRSIAQAATVLVDHEVPATDVAEDVGRSSRVRVTIVAGDGAVLADSEEDPTRMENHATRPEVAAALSGRAGREQRVSRTEGVEQVYVALPAMIEGERVAVRVSERTATIDAVAERARRRGLLLLVAVLALAAVIAVVVNRGLVEPVERLSAAAKRMAAGDLSADVQRTSGELGVLADALSNMRSQIRARIDDLEAEERNLRSVLDGLDDAVFLLSEGEILFANSAAERMFGTGRTWRHRDVGDAGLPVSVVAWVRSALHDNKQRAEELVPDPTGRSLRLSFVPLHPEDPSARAIVVVADVTERARLEHVRRDFVANASHELKTPVAGIQLLAESAANAASDGDDAQALAFAQQIVSETSRLQRLVRDLLDLSRLDTTPAPGAVADVRAVAENALIGHRPAAASRMLSLEFDDSSVKTEDVFVAGDPTDLAVALDNLLDNALAYTEEGGVVVRIEGAAGKVIITVEDTGIGIPEEDLPRIFERFYRVDRARTRESGGTGLGLSLVKHAVERSGGSVSVQSEVGVGTAFRLEFTRAR